MTKEKGNIRGKEITDIYLGNNPKCSMTLANETAQRDQAKSLLFHIGIIRQEPST